MLYIETKVMKDDQLQLIREALPECQIQWSVYD